MNKSIATFTAVYLIGGILFCFIPFPNIILRNFVVGFVIIAIIAAYVAAKSFLNRYPETEDTSELTKLSFFCSIIAGVLFLVLYFLLEFTQVAYATDFEFAWMMQSFLWQHFIEGFSDIIFVLNTLLRLFYQFIAILATFKVTAMIKS